MKKNKTHGQLVRLLKAEVTRRKKVFIPGKSDIPYAGATYGSEEIVEMVETLLSGWFGLGKQGERFEKELASYVGVSHSLMTNSGSSANLLAMSALKSWKFPNHLKDGDEVIVAASGFPTTISPIIQNRLVPVFLDVDSETYNLRPCDLEKALSKKSRLIVVCHNFGNPNEMDVIMDFAKKNNLYVFEDNCDALGSTYDRQKTGSFGIMASESFYPAHHITTGGEGGAVLTNNFLLYRIVQSIRDWGRACWCGATGGPREGLCGCRFQFKIDRTFYDHKYIFDHIGYNLKPVEVQAAMGRVQLKRLAKFTSLRKKYFNIYNSFFKKYEKFFILPKSLPKSDPSWFAYLLTIRDNAPFDRLKIITYLEDHHIQTRPSFSGNILRQPAYKKINHRKIGGLVNSNRIFENTFFIGVYPGLTLLQIDYVKETFDAFLSRY